MFLVGGKIKRFTFLYAVGFLAQRKKDISFEDVPHFFSHMGRLDTGASPGGKGHTNGFHLIFLCVWNQPFDLMPEFGIIFQKIIFLPKDDLLRRVIRKKFLKAAAETLQDIRKGTDGGGGEISLVLL